MGEKENGADEINMRICTETPSNVYPLDASMVVSCLLSSTYMLQRPENVYRDSKGMLYSQAFCTLKAKLGSAF